MLILASSSQYRQALLKKLHRPFSCVAPEIDESPLDGETPADLAARLARGKAHKVFTLHPAATVIGSDQVVVGPTGAIYGKPGNVRRAETMLREFSGKEVRYLTAICVYAPNLDAPLEAIDETIIRYRTLKEADIEDYLAKESALDCAGGMKSEGYGITLLEWIRGDDPNSLIGLPLIALNRLLKQAG